jgi:hypothetical protein
MLALDRATGAAVRRRVAPGGLGGWLAVAGDTIVWPVVLATPAARLALGMGDRPPAGDRR